MTGVVQNQDSYMKGRIGQRAYYDRLPAALAAAMADWARLTGRRYGADRAVPLRGRRPRSSSRWARSPTRPRRSSTTCAAQGRRGRLPSP